MYIYTQRLSTPVKVRSAIQQMQNIILPDWNSTQYSPLGTLLAQRLVYNASNNEMLSLVSVRKDYCLLAIVYGRNKFDRSRKVFAIAIYMCCVIKLAAHSMNSIQINGSYLLECMLNTGIVRRIVQKMSLTFLI